MCLVLHNDIILFDVVLTGKSIFSIVLNDFFGIKPYFATFVKHLNTI